MKSFAILFAALLLAGSPPAGSQTAPPQNLLVFANRSTPVNKMSSSQLRDVLLGEVPSWSNGRAVSVVFADGKSMTRALAKILKMTRDDYDNHFVVKRYQGQEVARPRVLPNSDLVLRFLTQTPGAITVLEGEPDMTVAGAKAIRIDGKLPGEDGYRY